MPMTETIALTYACGHTAKRKPRGSRRAISRRIAQAKTVLCEECRRAEKRKAEARRASLARRKRKERHLAKAAKHIRDGTRALLGARLGERDVFRGTFDRFGSRESKIMLVAVTDASGVVVADHLWFNHTKGFAALKARRGDIVEFRARVTPYEKGYRGRRENVVGKEPTIDYKLSRPTKMRIVGSIGRD